MQIRQAAENISRAAAFLAARDDTGEFPGLSLSGRMSSGRRKCENKMQIVIIIIILIPTITTAKHVGCNYKTAVSVHIHCRKLRGDFG